MSGAQLSCPLLAGDWQSRLAEHDAAVTGPHRGQCHHQVGPQRKENGKCGTRGSSTRAPRHLSPRSEATVLGLSHLCGGGGGVSGRRLLSARASGAGVQPMHAYPTPHQVK